MMPENEMIPINEGLETAQAETAKEKFERERLSRRQALKKFGMTSAMAAFALFSVDDLARMVGKAMQQRAGDNKIAGQIAQEFQNAGIAMAGGQSGTNCQHCCNQNFNDLCSCVANTPANSPQRSACINNANYDFYGCYVQHCQNGTTCQVSSGATCP